MNNPFDKDSLSQHEKDLLADGGWQCSFCATVNASYITTCGCSHNRDDSYENLHGRYVPRDDEEWSEAGAVEEEAEVITPATPVRMPELEPPLKQSVEIMPEDTPASTPMSVPQPIPAPKAAVSNTNKPLEEYSAYEQGILNDGGWECSFCARINANYITTCACGHSNDDSYLKRRGRYVEPEGEAQQEESAPTTPEIMDAVEPSAPEPTGAELIAKIEKELENNNSDVAKIRAIRKFKDLVKKGYMTEEDFHQKKEELLSFDEEEEEALEVSSGTAKAENDGTDYNGEDA